MDSTFLVMISWIFMVEHSVPVIEPARSAPSSYSEIKNPERNQTMESRPVSIATGRTSINGDLNVPAGSRSIVLFAHGSGSSRHSPRNKYVAQILNRSGISTLLVDLLTMEEETMDRRTAQLRFNIELLAD